MSTTEVSIEALVKEARASKGPLLAVADVGGNNTRFCLVSSFTHDTKMHFVRRTARSVPALKKVFQEIADALGQATCSRIQAGALAVPGPVSGETSVIANFEAQTTEGRTIRVSELPQALFPSARTKLLNDVEAAAFGVAGLDAVNSLGDVFQELWAAKSKPASRASRKGLASLPRANVLVVAPGTGLGSALLHFDRFRGQFAVLPSEFGHTTVPPLDYPELLKAYTKQLKYATEFDDVCTGRGMEFAYKFLTKGAKVLNAGEISTAAKAGDATALEAMTIYYTFNIALISQLVMGMQPELVVLAGDNIVNNAFYTDNDGRVEGLYARLMAHSMERMGFMSRTGFGVQSTRVNLNLVGCVHAANQAANKGKAKL